MTRALSRLTRPVCPDKASCDTRSGAVPCHPALTHTEIKAPRQVTGTGWGLSRPLLLPRFPELSRSAVQLPLGVSKKASGGERGAGLGVHSGMGVCGGRAPSPRGWGPSLKWAVGTVCIHPSVLLGAPKRGGLCPKTVAGGVSSGSCCPPSLRSSVLCVSCDP